MASIATASISAHRHLWHRTPEGPGFPGSRGRPASFRLKHLDPSQRAESFRPCWASRSLSALSEEWPGAPVFQSPLGYARVKKDLYSALIQATWPATLCASCKQTACLSVDRDVSWSPDLLPAPSFSDRPEESSSPKRSTWRETRRSTSGKIWLGRCRRRARSKRGMVARSWLSASGSVCWGSRGTILRASWFGMRVR